MLSFPLQPRMSLDWINMSAYPTAEDYIQHGLGPMQAEPVLLYIDLIKRTLTNIIYEDSPQFFFCPKNSIRVADSFSLEKRVLGEDCPSQAHTMIGIKRLENLQRCIEEVLRQNIPGDFIETGVLRGGATIFMKAMLNAYGVNDRRVFVCDTFIPQVHIETKFLDSVLLLLLSIPIYAWQKRIFKMIQKFVPQNKRSFPVVADPSKMLIDFVRTTLRHKKRSTLLYTNNSLEAVKSHFARYGLLDDNVMFLQGFFKDTLPQAAINKISVLRLDGDLYESTIDALQALYPKLSPGGFCIIDDYHVFPECRRAVDEYRAQHNISDEMVKIDNLSTYWKKAF